MAASFGGFRICEDVWTPTVDEGTSVCVSCVWTSVEEKSMGIGEAEGGEPGDAGGEE